MNTEERLPAPHGASPFERIRRISAAGAEYWSRRDFAQVLGYSDRLSFEQAVKRAKTACFNSGQMSRSDPSRGRVDVIVICGGLIDDTRFIL